MGGSILFRGGALLDVVAGELRPGTEVLIDGGRVVEVSDVPIRSASARVVDLAGRTLMPGLIDLHVHVTITTMNLGAMVQKPPTLVAHEAAAILKRMIRRGFTTIRDAAGADWGIAEAVERGLVEGPRVFFSGRALSQTGGHGDFRPRFSEDRLCAC